jgi:uncharacterized protein YukE
MHPTKGKNMAFIGMDIEQATSHQSQLKNQGIDALFNAIHSLDGVLGQLVDVWKGLDSTNFHSDWMQTHRPNLSTVHDNLQTFHDNLGREIQDQLRASGQG